MTEQPRICDYEGSDYRTRFWENQGRDYEDAIERRALHQLLPAQGKRLIEVGAAFGRLVDAYHNFEQIVLLDYSFSQLQYARQQYGDERFIYVACDAYHMPFKPAIFDCVTMIRVLHHFENVPAVFEQIRPTLTDEGVFVLEFANKRNLKAMLRHTLRRQTWHPNTLEPVEFVELNFNFHPDYIDDALRQAHFVPQTYLPVSWLRLGLVKRFLPLSALMSLDALLQRTKWRVAPSIFTRNHVNGQSAPSNLHLQGDELFVCPRTKSPLTREGDTLRSPEGLRWQIRDGIYDFKTPVD